jgi:general stress protein YciG
MDFDLKQLTLEQLYAGKNVRVSTEVQLPALRADILDRGLITPPICWENPESKNGKKYEILCGHRRFAVLKDIAKTEKDVYTTHFPGGKIPILVVSGISREKAQTIKVDGGTSVQLQDPYEGLLCACIMFDNGATESTVANSLSALLSRTSRKGGMSKDVRADLDDLEKERETARKGGQLAKMRKCDREIFVITANYHRGHVQHLHAIYKCPKLVMACKEFEATQIIPKGFEKQTLIRLTNNDVKRLLSAFREDLEIKENEIPKYSKLVPGPNFLAKYDTIVESKKKGGKKSGDNKPKKAMSSKAMIEEVDSSVWQSKGFKFLTTHHAGGKVQKSTLKTYDYGCVVAETIREHHEKEYKRICTLAEKTLTGLTEKAEKE